MKRSDESPNAGCDQVELLLIKKTIEELTGDESLLVQEHLKSCQRCRSLETTVVSMQDTMRTSTKAPPVPDPAVRQNILRQMNALKLRQPGIFCRGWQYVREVFEYRIPVYQTLLGAALVVLLFFAVRQLSTTSPQPPSEPQSVAQIETPLPGEMSVLDDLSILDRQKIGRNAKEDSYLTRFIVSTM
jgi:hypothetical protein